MARIALTLAAACIVAALWVAGSPARVACTPGVITYGAPYVHRIIATDVAQDSGADVFSYFAFNSPTDGSAPTPRAKAMNSSVPPVSPRGEPIRRTM